MNLVMQALQLLTGLRESDGHHSYHSLRFWATTTLVEVSQALLVPLVIRQQMHPFACMACL
jgi:hypothetical protein